MGDVTMATSGVSANAEMTGPMLGKVTLQTFVGTITVGNITVGAGGLPGMAIGNTDNLAVLSDWFIVQGTTVTIGNVDYTAYLGDTVINVSAYSGAGTISGGQGANIIVDNAGTNVIDLGASAAKADVVYLLNDQDAVTDTAGTVTADQTLLDSITGWGAGDTIALWDAALGMTDSIDGTGTLVHSTDPVTPLAYAQFLTDAGDQVFNTNCSAFVAWVDDGNTYVAINDNGIVAEVVKIVGQHHLQWNAGTLEFVD
jgi:hypothetical protein